MLKIYKACLSLLLPASFVWACRSSTSGGGSNGDPVGGAGGSGTELPGVGGDPLNIGGDVSVPSGGTSTTAGTTSTTAGTSSAGGSLATDLCGGAGCTCSNGIDDDEDGLIDGLDPECTGPLDNDESSFATGIPGDNRDPKWQDCFFDGNSGAGDDRCRYHTDCLTGDKPLSDKDCTLTQACIEFCAPRTPNGCDCFGCCTVRVDADTTLDILTGSDCSLDLAEDADACPPCVKSDACGNTCGRCELCPGKTLADLPADCAPDTGAGGAPSGAGGAPGGPGYTCDGGEQVCGPDLPGCALGSYCSLGCCILSPPK